MIWLSINTYKKLKIQKIHKTKHNENFHLHLELRTHETMNSPWNLEHMIVWKEVLFCANWEGFGRKGVTHQNVTLKCRVYLHLSVTSVVKCRMHLIKYCMHFFRCCMYLTKCRMNFAKCRHHWHHWKTFFIIPKSFWRKKPIIWKLETCFLPWSFDHFWRSTHLFPCIGRIDILPTLHDPL